ncbi:MAG: heavy metal-binding domain-containing protein [Clostridiales bacterium]|nr:heavy metal-binding domain-containing protein [Clostridiales bacterium]
MKTKEIARSYSFDQGKFDSFISKNSQKYNAKETLMGSIVEDNKVDILVADYKRYLADKEAAKAVREAAEFAEAARKQAECAEKQEALAKMLITSGFSFDGYTITKYSGYISGDDVVQVDRGYSGFFSSATNVGDALMNALVQIRRKALMELKESAYALGCNAVIGVDFDYLTLDPQTANSSGGTTYLPYIFGVTANGNAVIIEKNSTEKD